MVCEQKVEVNDTQSRAKKEEPVVESPEESETEVNTHNHTCKQGNSKVAIDSCEPKTVDKLGKNSCNANLGIPTKNIMYSAYS